jgi:large subunit ribosomal protein L3
LAIPTQVVLRHKTIEKDGYTAIVLWADKKKTGKYGKSIELKVSEDDLAKYAVGSEMTGDVLADIATVRVVWISKGKWFQWGMKRHNFGGWPKTHGSKFHRALGSTGNRKPRRTLKGQKMAGHMWDERITLKSVPVMWVESINDQQVVMLKGSVPGAYHTYLEIVITE